MNDLIRHTLNICDVPLLYFFPYKPVRVGKKKKPALCNVNKPVLQPCFPATLNLTASNPPVMLHDGNLARSHRLAPRSPVLG